VVTRGGSHLTVPPGHRWRPRRRLTLRRETGGDQSLQPSSAVNGSPEAAALLWELIREFDCEVLAAVYLDPLRRPIGSFIAGIGDQACVAVEHRRLVAVGHLLGASAFVVGHNHPDGDPAPSEEDEGCARVLQEAARCLDLILLDDLVLSDGGRWVSIRREIPWGY
jgi:DNA repair protein RadC